MDPKYKPQDEDVEELSACDEFEIADVEYEHWKLDKQDTERIVKCL